MEARLIKDVKALLFSKFIVAGVGGEKGEEIN